MKKITHIFLTAALILLLCAGTAIVQEFTAEIPDTSKNEIHLKWIVQESDGIMHYTLKRKMIRDLEFMLVNTIQPTSSNDTFNEYTYIDKNVFRNNSNTEPVIYELHVSYTNGTQELVGQTEVNYSSTAIRRTWGSIKAMFQ